MLLRRFNFFPHSQVKQIFETAEYLLFRMHVTYIVDTSVLESSGISRGFRCHHIYGCQWDEFKIRFLSG